MVKSQGRAYELWPGVRKGTFAGLTEDEINGAIKKEVDKGNAPEFADEPDAAYGDYVIRDMAPTFDLYALEEALFDTYESDFVRSVEGVDSESDDTAKSHAMTDAMLEPGFMVKTLSRLSHDELLIVGYLLRVRGGRWQVPDKEMPPASRLPLVGGWTYVFRTNDRYWDFVVPEQAQEIGRGLSWMPLYAEATERDMAVNLADVYVECFGAIGVEEFMGEVRKRTPVGCPSWDGTVSGWIRDAAERGRISARIVKLQDGTEALAHSVILRATGEDATCVDAGGRPPELSRLIDACLGARSDASEEMARSVESWVELCRREIYSESGVLLRDYLHWHTPDGASLEWPFEAFRRLCDRSKYAGDTGDLLDTLEILGLRVPAAFRSEIEVILESLLHEIPHWGCLINMDASEMPPRLRESGRVRACFPIKPDESNPSEEEQ